MSVIQFRNGKAPCPQCGKMCTVRHDKQLDVPTIYCDDCKKSFSYFKIPKVGK